MNDETGYDAPTENTPRHRMKPANWLPDGVLGLGAYMLLAIIVHISFAFWPYISVNKLGLTAPWQEGWKAGLLIGALLAPPFINMIIGASIHRKLCERVDDIHYLLGLTAAGFVMTVGFSGFAKTLLVDVSGGAAIWYGAWGVAGIFMMKPGIDHILDVAQPRSKKPADLAVRPSGSPSEKPKADQG